MKYRFELPEKETYKTIPVAWYRICAEHNLNQTNLNRYCIYKLGRVFEVIRKEDGIVYVTTDNLKYEWVCKEKWGQIFVWYGPQDNVGYFPDLPDFDKAACKRFGLQYINASLCESNENAADSMHFAYVHTKITKNYDMTSKINENGSIHISSKMLTQPFDMTTEVNNIIHYPGFAYTAVKYLGLKCIILGMGTPVDETHTETGFIIASPFAFGLGYLINYITYKTIVDELTKDIMIWEHKRWRENPILCEEDRTIGDFRRWFRTFFPSKYEEHRKKKDSV